MANFSKTFTMNLQISNFMQELQNLKFLKFQNFNVQSSDVLKC